MTSSCVKGTVSPAERCDFMYSRDNMTIIFPIVFPVSRRLKSHRSAGDNVTHMLASKIFIWPSTVIVPHRHYGRHLLACLNKVTSFQNYIVDFSI